MKKISAVLVFICLSCLLVFNQCNVSDGKVTVDLNAKPFERLSEYHFFKGDIQNLIPNDKLLPY